MPRGAVRRTVATVLLVTLAGAPAASNGNSPQLTRLLRREASVLSALEDLTRQVVDGARKLDDLRYKNKQLSYQIDEADRRIQALAKRIDSRRHHVQMWTRSLYKLSRGGFFRLLLDRDDGQQLTQRLSAARLILGRDRHEIGLYQRELEQLNNQRKILDKDRIRLDLLQRRLARAQGELKASRRRRLRILLQLKRSRGLQEKLDDELDQQQQTLLRRIAVLSDRAYYAWGFSGLKGKLPRPVSGPVVGVFGRAASKDLGVEVVRHGITIRPVAQATVRAVASGVVRMSGSMKGYGNLVLIEHKDGYFSLYGFLGKALAREGRHISYRGIVGLAGQDPLTGKPALYFELRVKERPLDPVAWLRR